VVADRSGVKKTRSTTDEIDHEAGSDHMSREHEEVRTCKSR